MPLLVNGAYSLLALTVNSDSYSAMRSCIQSTLGKQVRMSRGRLPGVARPMKAIRQTRVLLVSVLLLLPAGIARGQTPAAENEVWPKVSAFIELRPKTRLEIFAQRQNGEDFPSLQWNTGAMISYRMKRMVRRDETDLDEETRHFLVLGGGYEYLQTTQNDNVKRENRIVFQGTGRHLPGAGLLLTDRNRLEFRWVNGVYDFRYRNKFVVNRAFKISKLRLTPYASGELFWDRNHHSWGEDQYSFGVQFPYKKRLMLDTFYLHQNCTTCSQQHINVLGLTLNLYFRQKKK